MTRFEIGDIVVVNHNGPNSLIGKVGVVEYINRIVAHPGTLSHSVRLLQPTERGERIGVFSLDELIALTDTKLDKLPNDLIP